MVTSCTISFTRKSFLPVTAPCGTIKRSPRLSMYSCEQGVLHIGEMVCDDYWVDFQSSWSWGPTGSQRGAGTRITTTSCFLCWMTRSPATSCTASTPRMHWAMSGSSSHGLLTSLRYIVLDILHYIPRMQTNTHNNDRLNFKFIDFNESREDHEYMLKCRNDQTSVRPLTQTKGINVNMLGWTITF